MASSKRMTIAAIACAATMFAASPASAATLDGTVVGAPKPAAHGRVVIPVLLNAGGARAAGAPVAKLSVRASKGLRTKARSIEPGELRIGDRVHAAVTHVASSVRVTILRIAGRGAALPFARLTEARAAATKRVEQAARAVDQIKAGPMTLLDPATPAGSDDQLRAQLTQVRAGLNTLISDLRTTADGIEKAVATIQRQRPSDASRRAAAERRQRSLLAGLTDTATGERTAADQLDAAVTRLDQAIIDVGGASTPSIGLNEVGTVSDVLHAVLELLRPGP